MTSDAGQAHPEGAKRRGPEDRGSRSKAGSGRVGAQFALLHPERQLTLDGRAEPLTAPARAVPEAPPGIPPGQGSLFGGRQLELVGGVGKSDQWVGHPLESLLGTHGREPDAAMRAYLASEKVTYLEGGPRGPSPGLVEERISQPNHPQTGPVFKGIEACKTRRVHLRLWAAGSPTNPRAVRWFCRCWRHVGTCAKHASQREYTRLMGALEKHPIGHVVTCVLTLDREGRRGGLSDAFKGLQRRWQSLSRELQREFGGFEFYTCVEAHADGYPHMNVVVVSAGFASLCPEPHLAKDCAERRWNPRRQRFNHGCSNPAERWLRREACAAGFGPLATAQRALNASDVASYVTKISGAVPDPSGLGGEVTKLSQAPLKAPKRFRRTRSSKGFLPPLERGVDRETGERITGEIVFAPHPEDQLATFEVGMRKTLEHLCPSPLLDSSSMSAPTAAGPIPNTHTTGDRPSSPLSSPSCSSAPATVDTGSTSPPPRPELTAIGSGADRFSAWFATEKQTLLERHLEHSRSKARLRALCVPRSRPNPTPAEEWSAFMRERGTGPPQLGMMSCATTGEVLAP